MPIRYTVVATPAADRELMEIWTNAPTGERSLLARTTDQIDRDLAENAHLKGAPSPSDPGSSRRIWERLPLRVDFLISEPDRLVTIVKVEKLPP